MDKQCNFTHKNAYSTDQFIYKPFLRLHKQMYGEDC